MIINHFPNNNLLKASPKTVGRIAIIKDIHRETHKKQHTLALALGPTNLN